MEYSKKNWNEWNTRNGIQQKNMEWNSFNPFMIKFVMKWFSSYFFNLVLELLVKNIIENVDQDGNRK